MKILLKSCFTINSLALMLVVYFIKEDMVIPIEAAIFKLEFISYFLYLVGLMVISMICLVITKFMSKDVIEGGIQEIELADNSYVPTYLGYFFIALGVEDMSTLLSVFVIVFIFTYNSQTLYFNPIFLLFRYKFYLITTENKMRLFVVTRQEIKTTEQCVFDELVRINDYTFIDRRKKI